MDDTPFVTEWSCSSLGLHNTPGHCLTWVEFESTTLFHEGWIQLQVTTPKRGVYVNENLRFKIVITNQSDRNIRFLRAKLNQDLVLKHTKFGFGGKLLRSKEYEICGPSVSPNTYITWEDKFNISDSIRPTVNSDDLQIRHHILVEAVGKSWRKSEKVLLNGIIPIIIKNNNDNPLTTDDPRLLPTYEESEIGIAPPTYEEAMLN